MAHLFALCSSKSRKTDTARPVKSPYSGYELSFSLRPAQPAQQYGMASAQNAKPDVQVPTEDDTSAEIPHSLKGACTTSK